MKAITQHLNSVFSRESRAFEWSHSPKSGYLYLVADSHLDYQNAPYDQFIDQLLHLENPEVVICMGDLFHIWLAPKKFWKPIHQKVLDAFCQMRHQGCQVILVVGNRELIVPDALEAFDHIIPDMGFLQWGAHRYGITHGDLINEQDHQYLAWRGLVRSWGFKNMFSWMPSKLAQSIADYGEAQLSQTNRAFKIQFPEEEAQRFAKEVLSDVDMYFVGHFHTDLEIQLTPDQGILKFLPDWMSTRQWLRVDAEGDYQYLTKRCS